MNLEQLNDHQNACKHRVRKGVIKTFFSSLLAPFTRHFGDALQPAHYETEVIDDYVNHRHFHYTTNELINTFGNPQHYRAAQQLDVLTFSLQSAALVGFFYNIFNMMRS